jgi:hypothetical protein
MTFFSSAAKICSQGLITVAGEVANAIELILACVACLLPELFICGSLSNGTLLAKGLSAFRPDSDRLLHGSRLSAPEFGLGAWIISDPWDAGKLF